MDAIAADESCIERTEGHTAGAEWAKLHAEARDLERLQKHTKRRGAAFRDARHFFNVCIDLSTVAVTDFGVDNVFGDGASDLSAATSAALPKVRWSGSKPRR